MIVSRGLWSVLSSSILCLTSAAVFATGQVNLPCPTMDEISQYSSLASFPFGFNQHSKKMTVVAVTTNLAELDDNSHSNWALVIHPLEVGQLESEGVVVKDVLGKLQPVSITPFQYNVVDDLQMPVCIYQLPGNKDVNAMAYFIDNSYDDFDDDNFAKLRSKVSHHRAHMIKMAKQVKQFLKQ